MEEAEEVLRGEWPGYADTGSGAESAVDECEQEEEEETHGLADAFAQFEARLFDSAQDEATASNAKVGQETLVADAADLPAYVYTSDHFRLTKPPEFQHWRSRFTYLDVAGSALLADESMEHIQFVPIGQSVPSPRDDGQCDEGILRITGHACLQEPTPESQGVYEEIIACDGLMEEVLEQHISSDDEDDESNGGGWRRGCLSPLSAQTEDVLDALALECFGSTVVPSLTSFYETLLQKQQHAVQSAREEREATAHRAVHERFAMEEARRRLLEQEAQEEAARVEAVEKARLEEERREAERRDLLLKQQMEENDDEEVKIKTLAYSHTREWYQPNKKCFSHRGRQLCVGFEAIQESEEVMATMALERPSPSSGDGKRAKHATARKQPHSTPRHPPQPEWVTGGALTNDRLCNISWLKSSRPPSSPSPPPARGREHKSGTSRRARGDCNQKDSQRTAPQVQLPVISSVNAKSAIRTTTLPSSGSARGQSRSPNAAHAASGASPYRIPPRILAEDKTEHNRSSHHSTRSRNAKLR